MVDRLAVGGTLRNWAFAAPAAHTDPVYDIAYLSGGHGGREGGGLGAGFPRRPLRRVPGRRTVSAPRPGAPHLVWPCSPACAPCRAGWGAGRGVAPRAGGTASSAPAAGSMSRPTASSPQLLDGLVGAHVGSP